MNASVGTTSVSVTANPVAPAAISLDDAQTMSLMIATCFEGGHVRRGKSRMSWLLNGAAEPSPVRKKAAQKWARLLERLSKYIRDNGDVSQSDGPGR